MNNLALSEQTPVGTVVYKLEGYDPEGGNVSFGLIGSDNFIADPISGDVQVIKELDREAYTSGTDALESPPLASTMRQAVRGPDLAKSNSHRAKNGRKKSHFETVSNDADRIPMTVGQGITNPYDDALAMEGFAKDAHVHAEANKWKAGGM
uniref:Cadherin domain-containing protein n=1 Tax=Anopheles maculatus TaxID=74869 RepID=A0A182S9A9_9DIPT